MTIIVAASPSSASHTLVRRLENSLKTRALSLKNGNGIGNLTVNFDFKNFLRFFIQKVFFKEQIVYQHFFPTEYNLKYINRYFNLNKCKFIVTYRNIFEVANNLHKWKDERLRGPLSFRTNFFEPYENFQSKKFGLNILDLVLTINFFVMWFKISEQKYLKNIFFVNYDEIINNNKQFNDSLGTFLNKKINFNNEIRDNLWNKKNYEISDDLKKFIIEYCNSFKDVNFEKLGVYK